MTSRPNLSKFDPELEELISLEEKRQKEGLTMIASENFASPAVLEATGTVLTNKYAEGYPGRRYYTGNQYIDQIEQLAIDRAKKEEEIYAPNRPPIHAAQLGNETKLFLQHLRDEAHRFAISYHRQLRENSMFE